MKHHYKLWTIVSLIVVFAIGFLGGYVFDRHIIGKQPLHRGERTDRNRPNPSPYPALDMFAQELELTPEQEEQIREIFKNNEERFRALRKDMNAGLREMRVQLNNEIMSVLTEDQKAKYEAMIERFHAQRKREADKRKRESEAPNKVDQKGDQK